MIKYFSINCKIICYPKHTFNEDSLKLLWRTWRNCEDLWVIPTCLDALKCHAILNIRFKKQLEHEREKIKFIYLFPRIGLLKEKRCRIYRLEWNKCFNDTYSANYGEIPHLAFEQFCCCGRLDATVKICGECGW